MNKRGLPILIVAALLLLAGGVLLVVRGGGEEQALSSTSHPTPATGKPAETVNDALNIARLKFTASPPFRVHEIDSVVYVKSTVGEARSLFDPELTIKAWDAADDLPAWVVVASGRFQRVSRRGATDWAKEPLTWHSTVWVVVPKGEIGVHSGIRNEEYDLSQLGTVIEVPVPLAEFPDPIELGDARTATSADARPTSAVGKITQTLQGALNQAREIFTSAPPYVVHDIESVSYADTTVGKVRALFAPEGGAPTEGWLGYAGEDIPVWFIVAVGDFQTRPAPGTDSAPGKSYGVLWIAFAQGGAGRGGGSLSEIGDLSSLGTVVEVPVPLAEYPAPVKLN